MMSISSQDNENECVLAGGWKWEHPQRKDNKSNYIKSLNYEKNNYILRKSLNYVSDNELFHEKKRKWMITPKKEFKLRKE